MILPPKYFTTIEAENADRWDKLEQDPVLAGPWHQLFKQVQSPRHVISELMQNADDAGATSVQIRLDGNDFSFSHDGEDFAEEHFRSICQFGHSNKRTLHTIGFRGLGFKSTFSLGDEVYLNTPTLSVKFVKRRFTQPVWLATDRAVTDTTIRVVVGSPELLIALESSFEEWRQDSLALLFFRNLRNFRLNDLEFSTGEDSPGPSPRSRRFPFFLGSRNLVVFAGEPKPLPARAVEEIHAERGISSEETLELPPATVEVVFGVPGRLHVVLRTGTGTTLPFAINAPFIQDPARYGIKDPSISPTNRWLLAQAGQVAANAFLNWIRNPELSLSQRAEAYGLVPEANWDLAGPGVSLDKHVYDAFHAECHGCRVLLCERGDLVAQGLATVVPGALWDVWEEEQISDFLELRDTKLLCREVPDRATKTLSNLSWVKMIRNDAVTKRLGSISVRPPRPKTAERLLNLWKFLARQDTSWRYGTQASKLNVLPAVESDRLWCREELVRFRSDDFFRHDDPAFLMRFTKVLDDGYFKPLEASVHERQSGTLADKQLADLVVAFGIGSSENPVHILALVAASARQGSSAARDLIRLAQIAAHLGTRVGKDFPFLTRSGRVISVADGPIRPGDWLGEALLPDVVARDWTIAEQYEDFYSCTARDWGAWTYNGNSGLLAFLRPRPTERSLASRSEIAELCRSRGIDQAMAATSWPVGVALFDFDFPGDVWTYWEDQAQSDQFFWTKILTLLANTIDLPSLQARIIEVTGRTVRRTRELGTCKASWLIRLRTIPCVPDTRGQPQLPGALLKRTVQTLAFQDLVPFVHPEVDHPDSAAFLEALGVRTGAPGVEQVLEILRSLLVAKNPPKSEVYRWYERLDRIYSTATTEQAQLVRSAFVGEDLLLASNQQLCRPNQVFLQPDEHGFAAALVVAPEVRHLSLWAKLGVQQKPTLEAYLPWLGKLEQGVRLSDRDRSQVDSLYRQFGSGLLQRVRAIPNLKGEWSAIEVLRFGVLRGDSLDSSSLFATIQQATADLRAVTELRSSDLVQYELRSLASSLDYRLDEQSLTFGKPPTTLPWLRQCAACFRRMVLPDGLSDDRLLVLAERLERSQLIEAEAIKMAPFLDGEPAGVASELPFLWRDNLLIIGERDVNKWPRLISRELARVFEQVEVGEALQFCFGRSERQVQDYMESNFVLSERPGFSGTVASDDEVAAPLKIANDDPSSLPSPTTVDLVRAIPLFVPGSLASTDETVEPATMKREASPPAKKKLSLEAVYALSIGLEPVHSKHYVGHRGTLVHSELGAFPWVFKDSEGRIRQYLRFEDHCLARKALEIPAEVWNLFQANPESYTIVLKHPNDQPDARSGRELVALKEQGRLKLHAASFRLTLDE